MSPVTIDKRRAIGHAALLEAQRASQFFGALSRFDVTPAYAIRFFVGVGSGQEPEP